MALKLRTETFITNIPIPEEVGEAFPNPIVFYMGHKDDKRFFFTTFVIFNIKKGELRYIVSYLPENIELVENHKESNLFRVPSGVYNPHSSIQRKDGSLLTFVERSPFFYHVNYKENTLSVYSLNDLKNMTNEDIEGMCCTVYKDDVDRRFFYTTALSSSSSTGRELLLYKFNINSLESTLLKRLQGDHRQVPHATKKIGNCIFNSEFDQSTIVCNGKIFEKENLFLDFVYKDLYERFCSLRGIEFSEQFFYEHNTIKIMNVQLEEDFRQFCDLIGKDFLEICEKDEKYTFTVAPGKISVFNIHTGVLEKYNTTVCSPAHFEIDYETSTIYVSSHNFGYFDRHYYLGPAAIDKFLLKDGKLIKLSTFSTKDGYRFTTHKFFRCGGKSYVCVFGQPNRLFFIDAESMKMEFYFDIGKDYLSEQNDVFAYVNSDGGKEQITVKTMTISADGKYIFILSYQCMYIYNFPERRIVAQLPYWADVQLKDSINLKDFYKRTTHVDSLS